MNSRLKNVEERIENALARVDAAAALKTTNTQQNADIAALEAENASLRNQQDEISKRLDSAIDKLQRVLQGQ